MNYFKMRALYLLIFRKSGIKVKFCYPFLL